MFLHGFGIVERHATLLHRKGYHVKKHGKRRQNFNNQNRFEFAILVSNRIMIALSPTHGHRGEGIENLSFVFVQKKAFCNKRLKHPLLDFETLDSNASPRVRQTRTLDPKPNVHYKQIDSLGQRNRRQNI